MPVNYQLGKIYLYQKYIGTEIITKIGGHRKTYNSYLKGQYRYVSSFEILPNGYYNIILIQSYPCNSKDQLISRERYHIELNDCVNKLIGRTKKEYYYDNKERISEYKKEYYNDNKDQILEYKKEHYNDNREQMLKKYDCECKGKYCHSTKARHLRTPLHQNYIKSLTDSDESDN